MVVLAGKGTVRRGGRKIAEVAVGDVVGEMSLVTHRPRNASVTADTTITALVMSTREFSSLMDEHPQVGLKSSEPSPIGWLRLPAPTNRWSYLSPWLCSYWVQASSTADRALLAEAPGFVTYSTSAGWSQSTATSKGIWSEASNR